jgi:hypothetical protein
MENPYGKISMGFQNWLYPSLCRFCNWAWGCLEVPLYDRR